MVESAVSILDEMILEGLCLGDKASTKDVYKQLQKNLRRSSYLCYNA